ncbi:caldesmon-like [Alosa sapidissima]|uniref:caldesmon-like n=1 Tax=Alosa sapidissima TaxID=34773 RepID=UPI001C07FE2E|nr:caldesmon-like [Alosa sapidissima]XP_041966919.1 caldesmon-like [Alosa sapidissima]
MDRLSEGLRAALSTAAAGKLQRYLDETAEEAQQRERAMRLTIEKVLQDLTEAEKSSQAASEERQRERAKKKAAIEASIRDKEEEISLELNLMTHRVRTLTENIEMERQKLVSLEEDYQRTVALLEKEYVYDYDKMMINEPERIKAESDNWVRWTHERVNSTLATALTAAATKQKWLKELVNQAEKRMVVSVPQVSGGPAQEVSNTNKSCLNDGLQSLSFSSQRAEQIIVQKQTFQGKIDTKFEKKMARLVSEATKKEEKIKAAEMKKRMQLEEKTRKELDRIHKAELKEKKRKGAKEKKEAEKLERKRAKEERAETRQTRCCFCWRKSSSPKDNAEELNS